METLHSKEHNEPSLWPFLPRENIVENLLKEFMLELFRPAER